MILPINLPVFCEPYLFLILKKNYIIHLHLFPSRTTTSHLSHGSLFIYLMSNHELDRIRGGVIRIDNNSTKSTLVAEGPSKKPEQLKAGYYYHASGTTGWDIIVKPIK